MDGGRTKETDADGSLASKGGGWGDGWIWLGAGTATPRQLELSRDPATLLLPLFKSTTPLLD